MEDADPRFFSTIAPMSTAGSPAIPLSSVPIRVPFGNADRPALFLSGWQSMPEIDCMHCPLPWWCHEVSATFRASLKAVTTTTQYYGVANIT